MVNGSQSCRGAVLNLSFPTRLAGPTNGSLAKIAEEFADEQGNLGHRRASPGFSHCRVRGKAQCRNQRVREFLKIENRRLRAASIESPKPASCGDKNNAETGITEGIAERLHFERRKQDCKDQQDHYGYPECELNIRFPRQVGTCERDFIKADETDLGKEPAKKSQNREVFQHLMPWPERERQANRDQADREDRKQELAPPGCGDVLF